MPKYPDLEEICLRSSSSVSFTMADQATPPRPSTTRYTNYDRLTLTLVGDFDSADLLEQLTSAFGDWRPAWLICIQRWLPASVPARAQARRASSPPLPSIATEQPNKSYVAASEAVS